MKTMNMHNEASPPACKKNDVLVKGCNRNNLSIHEYDQSLLKKKTICC